MDRYLVKYHISGRFADFTCKSLFRSENVDYCAYVKLVKYVHVLNLINVFKYDYHHSCLCMICKAG